MLNKFADVQVEGTINTKEDQHIIRMGWIIFRTRITEIVCDVILCYFLTMKCHSHIPSSYPASSNNSSPRQPWQAASPLQQSSPRC